MAELTGVRVEILAAIEDWTAHYGYPPGVRDIGKLVGLTTSTAHYHVTILRDMGLITYKDRDHRTIRVVK